MSTRDGEYEGDEREVLSGYELLCALAEWQRESEGAGGLAWDSAEPAREILEEVPDEVAALAPEEPPPADDLDERLTWLRGVETLGLARAACAALAGDLTWARELVPALDEALSRRRQRLLEVGGWWRFGRFAEEGAGPEARAPWAWIRGGVESGEVSADQEESARTLVVEAWIRGELSAVDHQKVIAFVSEHEQWRRCYREALGRWFRPTRAVAVPAALRLEPLRTFPLPHLGRDARCELRLTDEGVALSWPRGGTAAPRSFAWEGGRAEGVVGDEVTGEIVISVERIAPDLGASTAAAVDALGRVQIDPDWPSERALVVGRAAAEMLSDGEGWRGALSRISQEFQEGLFVDEDDVLLVERALEARAALDTILFRYLDPAFGAVVNGLDESLANVADAVLTVPEERYHELLELADPEPGTWWAARQDLDLEVPAEVLEDAFEMGDEAAGPKLEPAPPTTEILEPANAPPAQPGDRTSETTRAEALSPPNAQPSALEKLFTPSPTVVAAARTAGKRPVPVRLFSQDEEWSVVVGPTGGDPAVKRIEVSREGSEIPPGTEIRLFGEVKRLVLTDAGRATAELSDGEVDLTGARDLPGDAILLADGTVVLLFQEE